MCLIGIQIWWSLHVFTCIKCLSFTFFLTRALSQTHSQHFNPLQSGFNCISDMHKTATDVIGAQQTIKPSCCMGAFAFNLYIYCILYIYMYRLHISTNSAVIKAKEGQTLTKSCSSLPQMMEARVRMNLRRRQKSPVLWCQRLRGLTQR